jgi:tRNA A-37 threonylcarbamoyl transferase component Bud32
MKYDVADSRFKEFILNIDHYFKDSETILFHKRNIIKIVEFDGREYVVKSFRKPHFLNQVIYRLFRDSKAKRSFENSQRLLQLDINVPKPVGYIEYNRPCRLQSSFFVSEYFHFDHEIRDIINNSEFEDREQILKAFVKFSYDLHQKGVYHIDYSPGNVLIKRENGTYSFAIIDLNRMKFIKYNNELRMKNLSRFSTSLKDLEFIAREYAELAGMDDKFAYRTLLKYHNRHQAYLIRKKHMKKIKGKS